MRLNKLIMTIVLLVFAGSTFADNLSVADVTLAAGESKKIAIELNNPNADYSAFQFDLVLPEGISIDKNKKDKLIVSLNADRIDDHTLNSSVVGSNTYRFICFSMSNSEFEDSEGDLLYVTLKADDGVSNGALTATIKSQVFTQGDGTQVKWSDMSFTITTSGAEVAVPVVTADNKTRVYGDENPELTYSADMELNGKPELSTTATKSSAVGEYDITVGKGTLTGDFTAKNGKLTITKAPLTVGVQDVTITEGDAIPTFTLTYSGWKNGDTEADAFTANPAAKTTATTSSKAGTYDITVSGGTAKNYELAYTKGTLTILKKEEPVTVTANNLTMVYGDDIPALTYKSEGAELNGTPQLSTTATKASAVGTYPIEVEAGTVTNTKATYVNGTLTITKAPLTVGVQDVTITEGDAIPTFTLTYSGWKNGDTEADAFTANPAAKTTATTSSEAGTYDITVSGGTAKNYELAYTKGTLTILKKEEPEPAYKVGDDITSLATADWQGKTGDYGGLANASVERYTHGTPADMDDILTQTVSGLENGTYRVQLEAAASFTPERGFDCPTGDGLSVVFANNTQRNLPVLERGWVGEGEQKLVTLTATVTDGTLKYGIKNLKLSGNWFVARLKSIVYISTEAQSPKTYAISIAAEQNGKTTTDVTADEEGSRVFITATPNEDCTLESLKVTTTGGKELEVTGNSFIMPASAVTVTATYKAPEPDAIEDVIAEDGVYQIFTLDGKPVETLQKGVNIIRYSDGTTKSVYVK